MHLLSCTNRNFNGASPISREYLILKVDYSDFNDDEKRKIHDDALTLINYAHSSAANTNITRDGITKENDAYAGILAEFAVTKLLNTIVSNSAYRPNTVSSQNQIDILWNYKNVKYSIEVRSSFVRNGIPFALYAFNYQNNSTYFDIIGPYKQGYKPEYDSQKDVYARVLFNGAKFNVKNRFINNNEPFYIIGFIDGNKLKNLDFHKTLKEENATFSKSGSVVGDYFVAPINKIIDVGTLSSNCRNNISNPFKISD